MWGGDRGTVDDCDAFDEMIIQYQNTMDEFIEASQALAARKKKKAAKKRPIASAAMALFFFAMIGFWTGIMHFNPTLVIFHLIFPIACSMTVAVIVATIMTFTGGKIPLMSKRWPLMVLVAALLFGELIGIRAISGLSKNNHVDDVNWGPDLLLPHTVWLLFVAWVAVYAIRNQRNRISTLWNGQLTLHRAKTADISAEGVAVTDAFSRIEHRWQAFVGWQETKSLIVLFPSELSVLFFPKSAFASKEELDAMRSLAGLILAVPGTAFPVVPLETASSVSVTK